MIREEVYKAIDTEREYQDKETANLLRPDVIEDFGIGGALSALQYNLNKANEVWYKDSPPYGNTMYLLRKIAGICVKMGEKYGMPIR